MAQTFAPALTKSEFLRVKPQGNYENYLGYLQRKRGAKWDATKPYVTQHYAPPAQGALPSYESMLRRLGGQFETPAQLEARANRMAQAQQKSALALINADYGPQREDIAAQYKREQDDAMRRMLAFQQAGRAAAAMNASLIGQVGGYYQQGANQLSDMAAGLTGQAAGATEAATGAANAAAANVGMPGVTVGGPVGGPGLAGPTQAGVESYYGGTLPAQGMQNAGGFAGAEMAGTIGAQNLRATQEAQAAYMQAMGEAGTTRAEALRQLASGRRSELAKIAASRPTSYADFLDKLQASNRQNYALAMSMLEGRRANQAQEFTETSTNRQLSQKDRELTQADKQQRQHNREWEASNRRANEAARRQGKQVDENGSIARGFWVDVDGNPILDKNGKKIKVPKSVTGSTTKSGTPIRQQMAAQATDWLYRHTTRQGGTTATKAQLVSYLNSLFPGNPGIARAIAESIWPKGAKGGAGSGSGIGTQP